MEATITQNRALYLAQQRNTQDRRKYFQRMRIAALNQRAVVPTLGTRTHWPLPYRDNGK
jgi:predicted transcriptional regulator of viral defense system